MIKHIAIIPDGNRRWAKKRGFLSWQGHLEGTKAIEKLLKKVLELRIPYLTFWGGSYDNLTQRSKKEIAFLIKIYEQYFQKLLKEKKVYENEVKINVFGRWEEIFPQKLKKIIEQMIEKTKTHNQYTLSLLLAYNGTDEMIDCIKQISKISDKAEIKINEDLIKKNLWTGSLPAVDLVIRTACESDPHNSAGFMMWQTAYSQFYFTNTLFPDFSPGELEKAINDFLKRERRFGQ